MRPMNREEFLQNIREAYYKEAYLGPDYTQPNPNFDVATRVDATMKENGQLLPNNFNWYDAATETGRITENTLSISGGNDRTTYLLSGGLVDQKGFVINDKFKRKAIRANIETKALNWWKIGFDLFRLIRKPGWRRTFAEQHSALVAAANTLRCNRQTDPLPYQNPGAKSVYNFLRR